MKFLAPLVLALALLPVSVALPQSQPETVKIAVLPEVGRVEYDTRISANPDVVRLRELIEQVTLYVESRCSCTVTFEHVDWVLKVVPYKEHEDFMLSILDDNDPEVAEKIRGDGALIDGFTVRAPLSKKIETYFYQWPSDSLLVHEMLHVLYGASDERTIQQRQAVFLASRYYKDWLSRNY